MRGIDRSVRGAEKRQRSDKHFGQQISVEIAKKLLENDGKLESQRMNVAVMCIDIRNFSQFESNKSLEQPIFLTLNSVGANPVNFLNNY